MVCTACCRHYNFDDNFDETFRRKVVAPVFSATVRVDLFDFAGLNIVSALITDMNVDASVLRAMNEINASRRQREAAVERAEAEKILAVKAAEAEAEAKELSGKGTARMRQAITEGFKGSIESMRES
jgi:regulator of protease activity HflC (stomatin/prohibitin superfamily)